MFYNPKTNYCVFPVFQEKPAIPPTQAQAQARNIPPEGYSYTASVLRLLRNKPFMLLVVSYGLSFSISFTHLTIRLDGKMSLNVVFLSLACLPLCYI